MEYRAKINKDEDGNEYLVISKDFISHLEVNIEKRVVNSIATLFNDKNRLIATNIENSLSTIDNSKLNGLWNTDKIELEKHNLKCYIEYLKEPILFKFEDYKK